MMAKSKKKGGGDKGGKSGMVQVVLLADVKGQGKKGEVVSVKSAFAENMSAHATGPMNARTHQLSSFPTTTSVRSWRLQARARGPR